MKHDHHEPTTPEEDYAIAKDALAKGDAKHAAFHLGAAIVEEPLEAKYLALVDDLAKSVDEALTLVPLDEGMYVGAVCLRVRLLARKRQMGEAWNLLLQAARVRPDRPLLAWGEAWLDALGELDRESLVARLAGWMSAFPGARLPPEKHAAFARILPILDRARALYPSDPDVLVFAASAKRKLGAVDEALGLANAAYAALPAWRTAIAVAMVHRARREIEQAVTWYERAKTHDPDDVSADLDMGDILCDEGRVEEGLAHYDKVLAKQPQHPWAYPHAAFYRARSDWGQGKALRDFARAHPDNHDAARLVRLATPFLGWLPNPAEATINVLRQLLEKPEALGKGTAEKPATITLTVSALEAPSARLAVDYEMRSRGLHVVLKVAVSAVQEPDPRASEGELSIWRYEGTDPSPAVGAPPPRVAEALANVASPSWFDVSAWFDAAKEVRASLDDLLAVMVHPPLPPAQKTGWIFLWHLQVAAALAIASLDAGWEGSQRKRGLEALLLGPMDWTTGAAAIALAELARREPEHGKAIDDLFFRAIKRAPKSGYCCYRYPLVVSWLRLPGLQDEIRGVLEEQWRALES